MYFILETCDCAERKGRPRKRDQQRAPDDGTRGACAVGDQNQVSCNLNQLVAISVSNMQI